MASVVYMFNAAAVPINVNINNGSSILVIPAAASGSTWAPGVPSTNPTFTGNMPAQGQFGYGTNNCTITPSTGGAAVSVAVTIPTNVNPADALQLYLYYQSTTAVSWVLLDNGVAVAGNLTNLSS